MQKNTKNHTLTRKKKPLSFCIPLLSFVVSPGGGAALNLKTLNPKPNSNLHIFPPRPQRTRFGFSCENSYCSFFFFLNSDSGSPSQFSHGWEPLKPIFSPVFTQNENSWFSMWEPGWDLPNTGPFVLYSFFPFVGCFVLLMIGRFSSLSSNLMSCTLLFVGCFVLLMVGMFSLSSNLMFCTLLLLGSLVYWWLAGFLLWVLI